MIDLNNLKRGATVKFRCGGEAVVDCIEIEPNLNKFKVSYVDNDVCAPYIYSEEGTGFGHAGKPSLFDIIEVIPAPFDWKDVKQGMCFVLNTSTFSNQYVYYIGEHLDDELRVVVDCRDATSMNGCYDGVPRKHLTRAPEYDIEVAE